MDLRFQCLILLLGVGRELVQAATERPNIVFIIADDMGWNDVGFNGGDVRTPNLDALAAQGIIISRHYTMPCCTPSRAALLTARYPIRNGMQSRPLPAGVQVSLPLTEKIFPQYFHELGYKTHLVGKWHLGYHTKDHFPTRRGFDTFFGYLNGYLSYYDATHTNANISGRDLRRNDEGVAMESYGKYLTGLLSDEAVSIIDNHQGSGGMLLFLMHAAPHTGNLGYMREAPPNVDGNATGREVLKEVVRHLDQSVGAVVKSLNHNGMLNNTIIVFLSDNGAPTVDALFHYDNYGSNWPLRGVKMSNRDGGVRTPSFIWSPMLRENPRVSQQLFHITDWLPTLYSAAGGNSSDLYGGSLTLDGLDQWASLVSSAPAPRTEIMLDINDIYNSESYILNHWKIVKDPAPNGSSAFSNGYYGESGRDVPYDETEVRMSPVGQLLPSPKNSYSQVRKNASLPARCNDTEIALQEDCYSKYCLYNLLEDPSECKDLSATYKGIVNELVNRLDNYKKVMVPSREVIIDPKSNPKYWDDYWTPWVNVSSASYPLSWPLLLLLPVFTVLHNWV